MARQARPPRAKIRAAGAPCPECEADGLNHDEVRKQCLESLYWTTRILCEFHDLSPLLHKQICKWYQMGYEEYLDHLFMWPRDHLKTSVITIGGCVWEIIKNPEVRIAIAMVSSSAAKDKLSVLRRIMTHPNGRFAHFFPERVPTKDCRVTTDKIEVPRTGNYGEATVTAWGVDSEIVSGHYDIFKLDDPIGDKDSGSEVRINAARSYLRALPGLQDNHDTARTDIIGTSWPGGFYEELIRDPLYRKLILGAEVDDRYYRFLDEVGYEGPRKPMTRKVVYLGEPRELPVPIWEKGENKHSKKGFTEKSLAKMSDKMRGTYSHQMLNVFIDKGEVRFLEQDLLDQACSYDYSRDAVIVGTSDGEGVAYPKSGMLRVLTIDPSSGEGRDASAVTVSGFIRTPGYGFFLEAWDGKVLTNELLDKVFTMAERWKVDIISPEAGSYQKVLKHLLRDEMVKRRKHYRIIPSEPANRGKPQRIDAFQPWVANHQVFFNLHDPGIMRLIQELCSIRIVNYKLITRMLPGSSPNLVDSACYHADFWKREPQDIYNDELPYEEEVDEPRFKHKIAVRYGLTCST